ncbi:MAG TPA: aminopeptidase N [Casimicrobiaceae bacterium]|nr:aminopeptidase N [Casimicrobiaceae bacterium]
MSPTMRPRGTRAASKRRVDYRPPAFLVDDVALDFDLDPARTEVATTFAFRRNPAASRADRRAPLVLDGEQQENVRVELDGRALAPDALTVRTSALALAGVPDAGTLTVRSTIAPARNVALEGLYVSSGVFCTQCEPEGFRRITYFPDRPDVLARYRVTLRADRMRYPTLLANGNLVASGALDGGRHYAKWHDPFPKPTYLFAVVAGDLAALDDAFITRSGRNVALRIFGTSRNVQRCRHAMEALKHAMRWDEDHYGREYDLDTFMIFCADDFNLGAMENKGLNIFNSRLILADPATATDEDFNAIEGVVGHEYFHNWTGNRVTCRDWFQLSLKEGLTVFRDQEFSSDQGSRAVERIAAVEYLRREQFAEDAGPMAHPVRPDEYQEINNFYTATVYEKGAELIRMQHRLLGPARFRAGMDLYFERHDGQAVTCDDFVQAMQDASGVDLTQFRNWYSTPGTPIVSARGHYDPAARAYDLEVTQRTPASRGGREPSPLHVPLALGLLAADGTDMPLRLAGEAAASGTTRVLELTQPVQRFRFMDIEESPVPSLLRGFSAPVRLEYAYSDEDLALLAAHDSDPVNRWDAAQRSFVSAVIALAQAHATGAPLAEVPLLARIARALLGDRTSDPALLAQSLALPDPAYVASLMPTIGPDGIEAAFAHVARSLASDLRDAFEETYRAHRRPRGSYAPSPSQAGARSLANLCLRYLGALDDERAHALALRQFETADNLTDAIGALAALRDSDKPVRADLYARFEAQWRHEPLVLDKWFSLQAKSLRPDTLETVRGLIAHPRFNARNPNRVRSLVGAFALGNFARFNARDGAGYAFVAEQVRMLDPMNPQLASTVAGAFNLWKRHDEPRRATMQKCLQRIARTRNLSPDVREVVTRALAS